MENSSIEGQLETRTVWVGLGSIPASTNSMFGQFRKNCFPHSDGLGVSGSPFHFLQHHHLPLAVKGEQQIASLYRSQLNGF